MSVVANLVVVPLSSLALSANALSLAVSPVSKDLASIFNASAWVWMHGMVALSRWSAGIPGGTWYVPRPLALEGRPSGDPPGARQRRPTVSASSAHNALPSQYRSALLAGFGVSRASRRTSITVLSGGESILGMHQDDARTSRELRQ